MILSVYFFFINRPTRNNTATFEISNNTFISTIQSFSEYHFNISVFSVLSQLEVKIYQALLKLVHTYCETVPDSGLR